MATPSEGYPTWALNNVVEVIEGKTFSSRTAPPPEVKLSGLKYQEPFVRNWLNYQFYLIDKWIQEFDLRTLGGTVQLGWITYGDTNYTTSTPFNITAGTTVDLPNNAGVLINSSAPNNGDTFYNGTKITGSNIGDIYQVSIQFTAKSTTAFATLITQLDIGDGITPKIINSDGKMLIAGASVAQVVEFNFLVTTIDPDFLSNGCVVQVAAVSGDLDIYDISYTVQRTFYKDNS